MTNPNYDCKYSKVKEVIVRILLNQGSQLFPSIPTVNVSLYAHRVGDFTLYCHINMDNQNAFPVVSSAMKNALSFAHNLPMTVDACSLQGFVHDEFSTLTSTVLCDISPHLIEACLSQMVFLTLLLLTQTVLVGLFPRLVLLFFDPVAHIRP